MTATGYATNYGANNELEALLVAPTWLGLHTDDPTALGSAASELIGGGYARQPIAFAAAAARTKVSVNAQVFAGLQAATIPFFAIWNAVSGGFALVVIELDTPIQVTTSGQLRVAVGDIAVAA